MPQSNLIQKYDRQIRLWGDHGQAALHNASVCIINAGPCGTETLKNLVLPGIGSFTIVDGSPVSPSDAGNNFFLPAVDLTEPAPPNRALAAARALLELNEHVDGAYIAEDPAHFLRNSADAAWFFQNFSIIIVTGIGVGNSVLQVIADGCEAANVPLLVVRAYGLVGSVRLQIPELCVLDAHPDASGQDLRLHCPFPDLQEFVDSFDMSSISDSTAASHIPYVVLLVKALSAFQKSTGKQLPGTRAEKDEFAALVRSIRPPCCPDEAGNFEEALKYSNLRLCYADAVQISDDISAVLFDPRADPDGEARHRQGILESSHALPVPVRLSNRSQDVEVLPTDATSPVKLTAAAKLADEIVSFWLHAAGVRAFVNENDGQLPVSGVVPDMTADTASYVTLQRLYSAKANKDASAVFHHVSRIAARRGESIHFDHGTVREFCKRLRGIRVLRYRSVDDECRNIPGSEFLENLEASGATDPSNSNTALCYYILLRAVEHFYREHGWYPGHENDAGEDDMRLLLASLTSVKNDLGGNLPASLWRDEAEEMLRFSNAELHNVASYLGGVAAQEAVKIITRQFVPLNNTMIVNFANMTSASFVA